MLPDGFVGARSYKSGQTNYLFPSLDSDTMHKLKTRYEMRQPSTLTEVEKNLKIGNAYFMGLFGSLMNLSIKGGDCELGQSYFSTSVADYIKNGRDLEESLHDKRFMALAFRHFHTRIYDYMAPPVLGRKL